MGWLIFVLNLLELAAFVTGLLFWHKIKNSYWRWFPYYLGIILLIELTAEFFSYYLGNFKVNQVIYRFVGIPFEFLFFFGIFRQYFKKTSKETWPVVAMVVYLGCWIADLFYIGEMKLFFDSFSYTIGNILLLILLLMFFIQFINSDEILLYKSSMMFWVCLGLMVFYVGTLPFYGLRTTLYKQYRQLFYVYWYTQYVLNYLMYILFIISFAWGRPK